LEGEKKQTSSACIISINPSFVYQLKVFS